VTGFERCDKCGRSDIELNVAGTYLLCEPCAMRNGSMRSAVLADHTIRRDEKNYHQDQDQDQDHDQGSYPPSSTPLGLGGRAEPSDLEIAIAEHHDGKLHPIDVPLGPMPSTAGPVMRSVADHMRLLMGLRAALGEHRPLPYACSMAVREGLAPDKGTASKAIRSLVKFGVVRYVGTLKPRGKPDGVKLYAPPVVDSAREAA
jgi:hypothetical protein